MAKFARVTAEVVAADEKFAKYLQNGQIATAKRGGTFVGNYEVAPDEFRRYGIVLPKGGMIIPDIGPEELKAALESASGLKAKRKFQLALQEFSKKNDVSFLKRLFATKAWQDRQVCLFQPLDEDRLEMIRADLAEYGSSDPEYFPVWIRLEMLSRSDVQWLAGEVGDGGCLVDLLERAADKKVGHLFLIKNSCFYPLTEESLRLIDENYAEALRKDRVMDIGSYRQLLRSNPQNAVVKKNYRSAKTTALEMFGVRYRFSDRRVADKVWARLRERFFVFESDDEAELAGLIASGVPAEVRESEESWTEGPKMRPEGKGHYIGGNVRVKRTFLSRFKIDDRWDLDDQGWFKQYDRLRRAHEAGVDISPRRMGS